MASVIHVTCDKCGATILKNRVCLDVRSGSMRTRRPSLDLCEPCSERLMAWLAEGQGNSVAADAGR